MENKVYCECKTIKEFFAIFDREEVADDYEENHLVIVYKDGSIYDSFDCNGIVAKMKNIYSAVYSNAEGYAYYNAIPRVEEYYPGEEVYFCDLKRVV